MGSTSSAAPAVYKIAASTNSVQIYVILSIHIGGK